MLAGLECELAWAILVPFCVDSPPDSAALAEEEEEASAPPVTVACLVLVSLRPSADVDASCPGAVARAADVLCFAAGLLSAGVLSTVVASVEGAAGL